jgi:hypothetical protein
MTLTARGALVLGLAVTILPAGCACERGLAARDAAGPGRDAAPADADRDLDATRPDAAADGGLEDPRDGALDAASDAATPSDAASDVARPSDGSSDARVSCLPGCGGIESCGARADGNGLDDDCDGEVDEHCTCAPGTARSCFDGPPERRDVGACADGVMLCGDDGLYGPCTGGRFPSDEVCDGADDDCDGTIDDGLAGCATALLCPGSERAVPLRAHPLNGTAIYGGAALSWSWTVTCPPDVPSCPVPDDPAAADTALFLLSSGNYGVRLDVVLADGSSNTCEWVVYARGGGLRVELQWDTEGLGRGDTDVDLHLHRRSIAPGATTGETDFFTADDCFYLDCKASTYGYDEGALRARWSLPDTLDLSVCEDAPGGEGGLWSTLHEACFNPRLDVDVISCDPAVTDPRSSSFCAPENINIDDPPLGEPYRIWVNYYSQHEHVGPTHPSVNVYCWGELRGSFGTNDDVVLMHGDPETSAREHDSWTVADVVFEVDECGRPGCRIQPLGGVRRDDAFGVPWSF